MLEKEIKKKIKNIFSTDCEPSDELYFKVKQNLNLNKTIKNPLKKWIPALTTSLCMLILCVIAIVMINTKEIQYYNAIVQIDVNPSISLVINQNDEVLSVSGLNDDGKMVIQNENIIGNKCNDVMKQIILLENKMGYLTDGSNNKITISITTESDDLTNNLGENFKNYLNELLTEKKINAKVETINGYSIQELKSYVKELDYTISTKELDNLTHNQLIDIVKNYQLETLAFATIKLEEFYNSFKKNKITLVEKKAIVEATDKLEEFYQSSLMLAYKELENTFVLLQNKYYDIFINSESEYQKSWIKLNDLYDAYIKQKNKVEEMKDNCSLSEWLIEQTEFARLTNEYYMASITLNSVEYAQKIIYQEIYNSFAKTLENIENLQKALPNTIKDITVNTIYNTTELLNEFKQSILQEFEEKYLNDIKSIQTMISNKKMELIISRK